MLPPSAFSSSGYRNPANSLVSSLEPSTAAANQTTAIVLAQNDPDVLSDIGGGLRNFYESGQIWALLIGIILGYVIRGITTYK